TADNKNKTYDGLVYSPFTSTLTGFVNSETDAGLRTSSGLSGYAVYSGSAATVGNASARTSATTPTIGTLAARNYAFPAGKFVSRTLTPYTTHLRSTADNKNKTYDGLVYSPFTSTLTGFVNSETDAGLRTSSGLSGYAAYSGNAA